MQRSKIGAIATAAMLASMAMSMAPSGYGTARAATEATASTQKAQQGTAANQAPGDTRTNRLNSQWAPTRRGGRRSGPGWTNAHAKRVARKARNVKRYRASLK